MNPRNNIQIELKTLSPLLAGLEKVNVFTVPEGYFDLLHVSLLEKCIFQSSFKNNPAQVPEGYFDTLADNILSKIKALESETAASELRNLSPMLYALQSEVVYTVPRGYFNDVADNTMARISRHAKVIAMKPVALWKYAAAAVVTGIIAVSSLWLADKPSAIKENANVAYEKAAINQVKMESAKYSSESQINQELASLPNDAIISYLENTGTSSDLELLASTIDQQDLPSQEDYLLDENALDKYLEGINNAEVNN